MNYRNHVKLCTERFEELADGVPIDAMPRRQFARAAYLATGMAVTWNADECEYRVTLRAADRPSATQRESLAYYTFCQEDALATAVLMAYDLEVTAPGH